MTSSEEVTEHVEWGTPARTVLASPVGSLDDLLVRPYSGRAAEINVKTFALCASVESRRSERVKSGLISSNDPVVRIVESGVSYVTPGDMSRVRSPGRSTIYRAATPGGGGGGIGRGPGGIGTAIGRGAQQLMRCPTGYQYGGRFSNRLLNNCGQQLFDVPGAEPPGAGVVAGPVRVTRTIGTIGGAAGAAARLVRAGSIGDAPRPTLSATLRRMADVPHVGSSQPKKVETAVAAAITAAGGARGDFVRLVRRDGLALDARVGIGKLASQTRNVDMQGGTIISRIGSPTSVGHDEVGLFRAGITSIRLVAPGGHEFRVDRVGDPKTNNLTQIGRRWGTIRRAPQAEEGAGALQRLVDASKGKLTYSETFNNIDKPNELVHIARNDEKKTVPRWVYLAYYADAAPGRVDSAQGWKEVGTVAQASDGAIVEVASTQAAARKVVQDGESLDAVPSRFLDVVLTRSTAVDKTDLGGGRTLLTRKNGEEYVRVERSATTALSEKVLADFQRAVGIDAPLTRVGGEGGKRAVISEAATTAVKDGKIVTDRGLTDVPPADLARLSLVDFMFGVGDRNPAGLAIVQSGHDLKVMPTPGTGAVPGETRKFAAIIRDPEKAFATPQATGWVRPYMDTPDKAVKQSISKMYDSLLKDASEFDWGTYTTRLSLDGGLSDLEKKHLEILQTLVKNQIEQLRSSKKAVLRILGAQGVQ